MAFHRRRISNFFGQMQMDLSKSKVHLSTWNVRLFWNNHPVPMVIVRQFTHEMRCDKKNRWDPTWSPWSRDVKGSLIRSRASQPFIAEKYVGRRCPGSLPLRAWTFKHLLCWPGAMQLTPGPRWWIEMWSTSVVSASNWINTAGEEQ